MVPDVMEASETKRMLVCGTRGANMGRAMMGCTVGIEALGSPWVVLVGWNSRGLATCHLRI